MKTITAKEFQLNHARVLRDVRSGQSFQVTFHRQPIATLVPAAKPVSQKPKRGSYDAIVESLKYTSPGQGDIMNLSYKKLRDKMIEDKYGKYFK